MHLKSWIWTCPTNYTQVLDQKRDEWEDLRLDLEGKLADAESLNNNLRSEIDKVQAENAAREKELLDQIDDLKAAVASAAASGANVGNGSNGGDDELRRQIDELKAELREQEEVRNGSLP